VIFLAALVQSTLGFGFALVAMPILSLTIGVTAAAPLVAVGSTISTVAMLLQQRREIDVRAAAPLILAAFVGVPFGLFALTDAPRDFMVRLLGGVVIFFSLFMLFSPRIKQLTWAGWKYVFGFSAGLFGGAYNINGPPIVLYGATQGWPPQRFRVMMQTFFLPTYLAIIVGHWAAGLFTVDVGRFLLWSFPALLLAAVVGRWLNRRLPQHRFSVIVYGACVCLGTAMFFTTVE